VTAKWNVLVSGAGTEVEGDGGDERKSVLLKTKGRREKGVVLFGNDEQLRR
jgi:hypothetical protein